MEPRAEKNWNRAARYVEARQLAGYDGVDPPVRPV